MKTHLSSRARQLLVALAAVTALGGCAVYTPAPAYYGDDSGVVYAAPAPAYAGPPVYLNFGVWGGGYHRGYHDGYRGGYRGGWHRGYR